MIASGLTASRETTTSADVLGTQLSIGELGLTYVSNASIPLLVNGIESTDVQDVKITEDGATITLSDLKIERLSIESMSTDLSNGTESSSARIAVQTHGIGGKCTGSFDIKYGILTQKGTFSAELKDNGKIGATVDVSRADDRGTNLTLLTCDASFTVDGIHFEGSIISSLLNLFKKILETYIGPQIDEAVCGGLGDVLDGLNENSTLLRRLSCGKRNDALSCALDMNIGLGSEPLDPSTFPIPAPTGLVPVNHDGVLESTHVELVLDMFSLNYLILYLIFDMELIDVYVTNTVLSKVTNRSDYLNTTALMDVVPELYQHWPNDEVQIETNVTTSPMLTADPDNESAVTLRTTLEMSFQVRDDDTFGLTTAFTLTTSPTLRLNVDVRDNDLIANVTSLDCTSSLSLQSKSIPVAQQTVDNLATDIQQICDTLAADARTWLAEHHVSLLNLTTVFGLTSGRVSFHRWGKDSSHDVLRVVSNVSLSPSAWTAASTRIATERTVPTHAASISRQRYMMLSTSSQGSSPYVPRETPYGASHVAGSRVIAITDYGASADNYSAYLSNKEAIERAFADAEAGDTVLVPADSTFYVLGGMEITGLQNVSFAIEGTIRAVPHFAAWPRETTSSYDGDYNSPCKDFLTFSACVGLTITSKWTHGTRMTGDERGGLVDGQGKRWWNEFTIGGELNHSHRPKLITVKESENVLVENLFLLNSPSFNLLLGDVLHAEVRGVTVFVDKARSGEEDKSSSSSSSLRAKQIVRGILGEDENTSSLRLTLQPSDLNTDGIDPSGRDVWVHDTVIINDDDSIAVKPCNTKCTYSDCSEDMLFENLVLSGFGASIGSVPPNDAHNCVRNVTFRNISMPRTGKGIYVKSNPTCLPDGSKTAEITNILFEDFVITRPLWWPIWIGPQQQQEPGSALGNKCSLEYPLPGTTCPTQGCVTFTNITLRNVSIVDPTLSPGVILGNASIPMDGIVFDSVVVKNPGTLPYWETYQCKNAFVKSLGNTFPVVDCENEDAVRGNQ